MKWLKQTFAQRYNRDNGRTGHLWGDRYWSRILEGEPPDGGEAGDSPVRGVRPVIKQRLAGLAAAGDPSARGVRPRSGKRAPGPAFFRLYPLPAAPAPG
ncbi:MAG: hypothetical protein LBO04_01670 [Spirochaetaceae bacterium]|jgi:hypothetical protein|nr:hypothetical protein [Spirochaetaceae bacterium]